MEPIKILSPLQTSQTPLQNATIPGVENMPTQASPTPVKVVIILPTSSYFTSGLRELSRTLAKSMSGFSEQWAYRFQSIVDELVNNAIEFGSRPGENIEITFLSMTNRYIEVFVKDTGTGTGGKKANEIKQFVEERKKADPNTIIGIRGRGLAQIVAKWADVMEFSDNSTGGITAHVIKNFQQDEEFIIPV